MWSKKWRSSLEGSSLISIAGNQQKKNPKYPNQQIRVFEVQLKSIVNS